MIAVYLNKLLFLFIMVEEIVHSFEAGRRGKPDELDSGIAQVIGGLLLRLNIYSRFDLRVNGGWDRSADVPNIGISGEISESLLKNTSLEDQITRAVIRYYNAVHKSHLQKQDMKINYGFVPQSDVLATNTFAGDEGRPIAVAYEKSPFFLPWER